MHCDAKCLYTKNEERMSTDHIIKYFAKGPAESVRMVAKLTFPPKSDAKDETDANIESKGSKLCSGDVHETSLSVSMCNKKT